MRYRVTHRTEYVYGESVPLSHNIARLRPRDTALQTCHNCRLSISPAPAARRDRIDFFGNHVTWICVQEPHPRLRVEARSEVEVTQPALPAGAVGPPWDETSRFLATHLDPANIEARQYTYDSPFVARHPELAEYARPSFPAGQPLLTCLIDLMERIHKEFTFDSGATTVGTPVLDVLRHRHGVCQDFAHVQIGCLRSLGLPARYVSGYLVTRPPPGMPRLVGCDASHAWLSAYIPELGWVDFDPTNGLLPSGEHITLGWARDYDDISPVKGVIIGGHRHALRFAVDVEPLLPANKSTAPPEANSKSQAGANAP